jgi:hypothetical protein
MERGRLNDDGKRPGQLDDDDCDDDDKAAVQLD